MADCGIWISPSATSSGNWRATCYSAWRVGLTRHAAVSHREHVVVVVQNLRISPVATWGNRRGSCATLGSHGDCQDLTRLHRQDCARVGSATSAASPVTGNNGSAAASAIQFHTQSVDASRHDESARGLKFLSAVKARAWRSNGTLGPHWSGWPGIPRGTGGSGWTSCAGDTGATGAVGATGSTGAAAPVDLVAPSVQQDQLRRSNL